MSVGPGMEAKVFSREYMLDIAPKQPELFIYSISEPYTTFLSISQILVTESVFLSLELPWIISYKVIRSAASNFVPATICIYTPSLISTIRETRGV